MPLPLAAPCGPRGTSALGPKHRAPAKLGNVRTCKASSKPLYPEVHCQSAVAARRLGAITISVNSSILDWCSLLWRRSIPDCTDGAYCTDTGAAELTAGAGLLCSTLVLVRHALWALAMRGSSLAPERCSPKLELMQQTLQKLAWRSSPLAQDVLHHWSL